MFAPDTTLLWQRSSLLSYSSCSVLADETVATHKLYRTDDFARRHAPAEVRCSRCGWRVVFPPDAFNKLFDPPVAVFVAERRLRCRQCGHRGATISLAWREYHG